MPLRLKKLNRIALAALALASALGGLSASGWAAQAVTQIPSTRYSTFLGGNSDDRAYAVALDAAGNIYIAGLTYSTDLPRKVNEYRGSRDVFLTKLDPTGKIVRYTVYLGGSQSEALGGIAVDAAGNVWVTGDTASDDFPLAAAIQSARSNDSYADGFVSLIDGTGQIVFSSYLGTPGSRGQSNGNQVTLGANGAVYLAGKFGQDFMVKLDAQTRTELNRLQVVFDNGEVLEASDIAVDGAGNIFVTGKTDQAALPVQHATQPACAPYDATTCSVDAFLLKTNDAGDLLFGTYLGGSAANGGSGADSGRRLTLDNAGNVYVMGETLADDFPTRNAFQSVKTGANNFADVFVTQFTPTGAGYALGFSTYLSGQFSEYAGDIVVDANQQVHATGQTDSPDFPMVNPLQAAIGGGVCNVRDVPRACADVFVTKFALNGSVPFSTYRGGNKDDSGAGIAAGAGGTVVVTGFSESSNFPTTTDALQPVKTSVMDAFIWILGATAVTSGTVTPSPGPGNPSLTPRAWLPLLSRGR